MRVTMDYFMHEPMTDVEESGMHRLHYRLLGLCVLTLKHCCIPKVYDCL